MEINWIEDFMTLSATRNFSRAAEARNVTLPATITEVHFMGSVIRIKADTGGNQVSLDTFNRPDTPPPPVGAKVILNIASSDFIQLGM